MQTGFWQRLQMFISRLAHILTPARPLVELFNKFNNDWDMNAASGLAYNILTAIVPMVIALVAVFGLTVGQLDAQATTVLIQRIQQIFPSTGHSTELIDIALTTLRQRAGWLGVLAVLTAIFGGSRLFVSIEGYFDIIYRTAPRKVVAQNVMAILMMIAFLILIPLMIFASSIPALFESLATVPVIDQIPGIVQITRNAVLLSVAAIAISLVVSWILFMAIYVVVPNMRLSFSHSWRGAVVAAIGLEIFLALFPFYTTHFMGSYTGAAGFILILLAFFYYFAVILLAGAEINAYFALGVSPLPNNIAVVLRDAVGKKPAESAQKNVPVSANPDENTQEDTPASAGLDEKESGSWPAGKVEDEEAKAR